MHTQPSPPTNHNLFSRRPRTYTTVEVTWRHFRKTGVSSNSTTSPDLPRYTGPLSTLENYKYNTSYEYTNLYKIYFVSYLKSRKNEKKPFSLLIWITVFIKNRLVHGLTNYSISFQTRVEDLSPSRPLTSSYIDLKRFFFSRLSFSTKYFIFKIRE